MKYSKKGYILPMELRNPMSMTEAELRRWYEENVPHYRELCRVDGIDGCWIVAGDREHLTIAIPSGKYFFNVHIDDVEFTGGKMMPIYEDM